MGDYDELYDHIDEMSEIPREGPFIDAWGEEYMSPTKEKREMKKGNYKKVILIIQLYVLMHLHLR